MGDQPNVILRPACPADAQVIANFNIAMARETEHLHLEPPTVLAGVTAALADPHKALYFLAEVQGQIAAQLMITHEWSDWRNGDVWWIQSVYVHPDHRRRGLFRKLYDYVSTQARQANAAGLRLYVERENTNAQKTYASLGMDLTHYLVMEEMFKRPGA